MCRPYKRAGQFPVVTLIRPLRGRLSLPPLAFGHFPLTGGIGPLEGGRLSGDRKGRPYGVFCTGIDGSKTQAQLWSFLVEETTRRGIGLVAVSHSAPLLDRVCTRRIEL